VFGDELADDDWRLNVHVYGKDGTMGALEPVNETKAHELCLLFLATRRTRRRRWRLRR
jgi:hypothetical protein